MKYVLRCFLVAAITYSTLPEAAAQTAAPPAAVGAGVFTAEQATRGEQIYFAKRSVCHGDTLSGMEMAPPLAVPAFRATWERQPLPALANRVRTMPPNAPNTLTGTEVADVISYILTSNGLSAGSVPLRDDSAGLQPETP
jgi:mono/diheme cytochrome c family protein